MSTSSDVGRQSRQQQSEDVQARHRPWKPEISGVRFPPWAPFVASLLTNRVARCAHNIDRITTGTPRRNSHFRQLLASSNPLLFAARRDPALTGLGLLFLVAGRVLGPFEARAITVQALELVVDADCVELRGIEPLTSSMPWKRSTN